MIANVSKSNTGKLLVAMMAMFLVVVGATVAFSDSTTAEGDNEATIDGEPYTTFADAIADAEEGDTIVLQKDVTLNATATINGLNVDGNGHTITTSDSAYINFQGAKSTIYDAVLNSTGSRTIIDVSGDAIVMINNCQFTGTSTTAVYVNFHNTTDVEINDCSISDDVMKEVILALGDNKDGTVEINDSTGLRVNIADATTASGVTLGDELIINNSPVDRLNVDSSCTLTIAQGDVFTANLIRGTGTIVNNGTVVANAFVDSSVTQEIKVQGNYAFRIPAGMTATVTDNNISLDGTPVSVNDATYKALFSTAAGAANTYAGIVGLSGSMEITQKNPYLATAYPGAADDVNSGFTDDTTKVKKYNFTNDNAYYFLLPTSGNVEIVITIGGTTTTYKFSVSVDDIEATATTQDELEAAIENPDVTTVTYTGTETLKDSDDNNTYTIAREDLTLNISIDKLPATTTLAEGTVLNLGDITTATSADKSFSFGTTGSVTIKSGFTGENISVKQGSVEIAGNGLKGTLEVSGDVKFTEAQGQIQDTGSAGLTINKASGVSGNVTVTIDDDFAVGVGDVKFGTETTGTYGLVIGNGVNLVTASGKTVTMAEGAKIGIAAGASFTAGTITGTGTITVLSGATLVYGQVSDGIKIEAEEGSIVKIEGGQGTENIISTDMTVTGDMYLSQNTTIMEGVTVTVTRNSTLHLMAFDLINNGNIVVDRNGTIVSDNGGEIRMMTTGTIQNSGIIGGSKAVTIVNGASPSLNQSVSIQGIDGISFQMVRTGTGADRVYNMYVSGDIGRVSGATVYTLTLNNVGINADMNIGNNVTLDIDGTVTVLNDVAFIFNGTYMDASNASFVLQNGASATVGAPMNGKISVSTGEVVSGNNLVAGAITATVDLGGTKTGDVINGVTGITVSVDRINVYDEANDETDVFQQMYLNGTAAVSNNSKTVTGPTATLAITGTAFVSDTLNISKGVTVTGFFDIDTAGTVVVNNDADDTGMTYSGARYVVETTENASTVETTYYTTFANAMAAIATAQDTTVFISGTYEITGTYTIEANQVIEAEGANQITVGETGDLTVELDADVQDTAFYKIYGKVLVKEGIGYTPSATAGIYAVKAVDNETNDTTYSGFGVAMDEAQSGQTITVVGEATYDGNLIIPNGVTVDIQQDIPLKVLGNVTVENGGKLILDSGSVMTVGKTAGRDYTISVAGELDASEGGQISALANVNVDFYSTGTSTFPIGAVNFDNVDVNAAYYDDADRVYTTLAAAVEYAETNALTTVFAVGTFSETGAIESDDVDIAIANGANVTLGDIILNAAKISVTGTGVYTANVSGLSGAGDAAVTSTVSVSKTDATIENKVTLNAEGVNQYVLTISGLKGATTISAGTVQFADDTGLNISRDNALTIASGATLLVAEGEDLSISIVKADPSNAGYFVNNGAIQVDGTLSLPAASTNVDNAVLPGIVNVSETGAIDAADNVIVTGDVTVAADGAFTVAGIISVGEAPDYLGETATGSVSGTVILDGTEDNYVVVYAGASVADAIISSASSTEPETTAFQVNSLDLMTVYTFGSEDISDFEKTVRDLDDLVGYDSDEKPITLTWTAEGNTIPNTTPIGEYAIVSTELAYKSADIVISVGTHITVTIDGIIVGNSYGYPVKIGTHIVSATVDPGFSGDVTITFNGQTVSNGGTIEITSEMLSSLDSIVLSVTGSLTQDTTVVVGGDSGSDDGMSLTDILLIVLVVLILVMAIIVALRLMRS